MGKAKKSRTKQRRRGRGREKLLLLLPGTMRREDEEKSGKRIKMLNQRK